jgi:gas vesicle protein
MNAPDNMNSMNSRRQEHRDYGFAIGLLAGTVVGAGLTMWLAPRVVSELRQRASDSARGLGRKASDRFQQASTGVGDAVVEIARKGRGVRDDVAEAVVRGAHEVERYATAAKSDAAVRAD